MSHPKSTVQTSAKVDIVIFITTDFELNSKEAKCLLVLDDCFCVRLGACHNQGRSCQVFLVFLRCDDKEVVVLPNVKCYKERAIALWKKTI